MLKPVLIGAVLAAMSSGAFAQGLEDENLLTGIPDGFASGYDASQNGEEMHEFVPKGESVTDWSQMVTIQIFHGAQNADVKGFAQQIAQGWTDACKGGAAGPLTDGAINGYPFVTWRFTCPLNPQSGKPETMWMKAISGGDAAYVVQYAYRSELSPERETTALGYLEQASACDTRTAEHPCPAGM